MRSKAVVVLVVLFFVVSSSSFGLETSGGSTQTSLNEQAAQQTFERAITTGMTRANIDRTEGLHGVIPKAVVYYSQYSNIIGYYRIESLVRDLNREHHERQFGRPYVIYVSDFSDKTPHLNDLGILEICEECDEPGMVFAENAVFVVGSGAQTYTGQALAVPFSEESDARRFATENGGQILKWEELRDQRTDDAERTRSDWEAIVDERDQWADERVTAARETLDRPVSVVVGRDAPTIQAAIQQAPPNTTIRLPAGTYQTSGLLVDKPITIRGAGNATEVRGLANQTTIQFFSERSTITSLRITAAGDRTPSNLSYPTNYSGQINTGYLLANPALRFYGDRGFVNDVYVEPASTGIAFSDSDGSVVNNVTVVGEQPWHEGFTSVLGFRSQLVVQNSRFIGGRGGVYFHRSDGGAIRANHMEGMRSGVRSVFNSETYIANNTIRDTVLGVHALTRQTRNTIVRNDIRESDIGIGDAGRVNYIAENVVVNNERGMRIQGSESLYTRNVVAHNRIGVQVGQIIKNAEYYGTVVPTTRIVANDFIANDRHVRSEQLGPLQVWSANDRGNYWSGAPGVDRDDDGVLEREFRVTGLVDSRAYRVRGGRTMALSPAVVAMRGLQSVVPGLQSTGVLDTAPMAQPTHPEYLPEPDGPRTNRTGVEQ